MILRQCLFYDNDCYKKATMIQYGMPAGIVIHGTDLCDPKLCRYIQPSAGDLHRNEILADLGKNTRNTHLNRPAKEGEHIICAHVFIGKNTTGVVESYQTLPFDYCCRGVGKGAKGSYSFNPQARIQIVICAGTARDKSYFNRAWREATELCAYLCKLYGMPKSWICSHQEAFLAGYGDNHCGMEKWLAKFGTAMEDFRNAVGDLLTEEKNILQIGDSVSFTGSMQYLTPYASAQWKICKPGSGIVTKIIRNPIYTQTHSVYVKAKHGSRSTVDGWVDLRDVHKDGAEVKTTVKLPYMVHMTGCGLNIRYGPGTNYPVARVVCGKESFTVIEESDGIGASKWGKVEHGEGWISLDYVHREI